MCINLIFTWPVGSFSVSSIAILKRSYYYLKGNRLWVFFLLLFFFKLLWIFSYVYIHIYSVQVVDLLSFTDLWFYVTTAEHDKNTASKTYFVFKKKYWCTSPINEQIFLFGSWMVEGWDLSHLPWLQRSSDAQSCQ